MSNIVMPANSRLAGLEHARIDVGAVACRVLDQGKVRLGGAFSPLPAGRRSA
jgi:hypothetical protein